MSENITPRERLEQVKKEYQDDPEATAILNSKFMQNILADLEESEKSKDNTSSI